jgi:hypothetical protein
MQHVWQREELHAGVQLETLRGKNHLEDIGVDGRIILKRIFKK